MRACVSGMPIEAPPSASPVHVVAAILRDARGRILLSRRTADRDLAGLWEFPGGKVESGESPEAALAREFGIDPAHLGRLVRRATGLGFRDWKLGIRLRLAVRALAESDAPVKWVAHESGFASTAQFDRGFRRVFGMTPGEFRRLAFNHVRRR